MGAYFAAFFLSSANRFSASSESCGRGPAPQFLQRRVRRGSPNSASCPGSVGGAAFPGTTRCSPSSWFRTALARFTTRSGSPAARRGCRSSCRCLQPRAGAGTRRCFPGLPHRDVQVAGVGQALGELHQLVIVGGEHGLAPDLVVEVLGDRPRDGHTIVGRGAAPDFIEQHEAPGRGVVEDRWSRSSPP